MPKSTTSLETPLRAQLDRLAAFDPVELPVISLYLDMSADEHGRRNFESFLRKALAERQGSYAAGTPSRQSFEVDATRIQSLLEDGIPPSANGLAIFACHGAGLFETIQLNAPFEEHWLFVGPAPHLYPLARVNDQFPRYAALVVDTNAARLFVFSLGDVEAQKDVKNAKTRKTSMGGWSQARYQRHIDKFHEQHMKEVVEVLDRVVREEAINQIVVSCDEVARPLLMQELPKHLAEKVVDIVRMDITAPDHEVLRQTLDALRAKDAGTDQERVEAAIGAWRGGGLGVAGPEHTLRALEMNQVEELLIAANPSALRRANTTAGASRSAAVETSTPNTDFDPGRMPLADELIAKAQATAARIRFIENADLLADVGGVAALLRFKV